MRGDAGRKDDWRYIDGAGHSISSLTLYRFLQELDAEDNWEGTRTDAIERDLDAQYAADPTLVQVRDFLGRVVYVPVWEADMERI